MLRVMALLGMLMMTGCANALTYQMTQQELQTKVEKSFPLQKETPFAMLTFSSPRVVLKSENNRLGVMMNVLAESAGKTLGKGTGMVDGELEYVAASGEFRLRNPKVNDLVIDGLSPNANTLLQGVASDALARMMPVIVVYKLDEKEFRQSMAKRMLKSIRVESGRVVAEMEM